MIGKAVKLRFEYGLLVLFWHFGRVEHPKTELVEAPLLSGMVRR